MPFACISIGSNLNQPSNQVEAAIQLLEKIPKTMLLQRSKLYETGPWGVKDQPNFVNAIAGVDTQLQPLELLDELQKIENTQGRVRDKKWGPRVLDLDMICYGQLSLDHPRLKLPHPFFSERAFVLEPLVEIYPDLVIDSAPAKEWLNRLQKSSV